MKNMTIQRKLLTGFIIVAIIAAIVGSVGIFASVILSNSGALLNTRANMGITSARINRYAQEERALIRGYAMYTAVGDLDDAAKQKDDMADVEKTIEDYLTTLHDSATDPNVINLLNEVENQKKTFQAAAEVFMNTVDTVKNLESKDEMKTVIVGAMNTLLPPLTAYTDSVTNLTSKLYDLTDVQAADMASTRNMVIILLIVVSVVAVIVAVILGRYIASLIVPQIHYVSDILSAMGQDGRVTYTDSEWATCNEFAKGNDETALCCKNLGLAAHHFGDLAEVIQTVATGDLTPTAKSLGRDDIIANSVTDLLDNLNAMFADIDIATSEVNSGAGQISNASQALSQGATEQASSVEELAATISNISTAVNKSAENAVNASKTAADTGEIMEGANKKMKEMVAAMENISNASNEISKIIKTIEDIAFQTNILALNASVEAARAGAAGKGFAVVANEVGSLASKSAEASKSTASLIESSVKAVEVGTKIVDDTAKSLIQAVKGAEDVVIKIDEISKAAEQQADSLSQVTLGVDQISAVVQTNSATAEECAASAEELNAQANMLSGNVAKFKIKGRESRVPGVPSNSYSSGGTGGMKRPVIDLGDKY